MTEEKLKQTCEVECLDNGYLLHDIDDGSKSAAIFHKIKTFEEYDKRKTKE